MDFLFSMKCCLVIVVSIPMILVGLWIYYQWKNKKLLVFANSLPVLYPRRFLIGNLGLFIPRNKRSFSIENFTNCFFDELKKAAGKRYELFCLWIGPKPLVFVQNPTDIQKILNNSKALDKGLDITKIAFGEGLIVAPVPKWKRSRKLISQIFHPSNLNKLVPIWNESSSLLLDELQTQISSGPIDVYPEVMAASVRSVCGIIFGSEVVSEIDRKTIDSGIKCMSQGVDIITVRCLFPIKSDFIFKLVYKKELSKSETLWNTFVSTPFKILKNKKEVANKKHKFRDIEGVDARLPTNLLETLSGIYSDHELDDEIKTLFGTGTETVAVTLCSCLRILGKHQEIQETLFKEIVSVTGSQPRDVTIEDLNNLPYLHRVIREVLRISLVVPLVPRKTEADIRLQNTTLIKGDTVILSIVGLHFDPDIYPDPKQFDPDRHLPEKIEKMHPYSFLPFGGGPRNCIGKTFAYMSLKISLIHLMKAFKVTSKGIKEDIRYFYRTTLASVDGYVIDFQSRN